MKLGIDSYCYHRFFGEVYPQQSSPRKPMTMADFVKRARELAVDGVSVESCFFPSFSSEYLAGLKEGLDEHGLDRVYAWGQRHSKLAVGGGNPREPRESKVITIARALRARSAAHGA